MHRLGMLFVFAALLPASAPASAAVVTASVAPTATPCPSASPMPQSGAAPLPSPAPCATAASSLREIGRVVVGRSIDLVGIANAASEGTIGPEQIATRPILRPGELLEEIPGLVISQHSGEGKANQYYLRGFQLDHGTDLESTVDDVPVNMVSHAHGQGYSDINWLIPELVSYVRYRKGPYYASQGDFSTAGSYELFYRDTVAPTAEFGIGDYGYDRLLLADAPKAGTGHLLYGLEVYHDNGTFERPDEYHKVNGVLRYSFGAENTNYHLTASGYNGPFDSTDQIPQRLVSAGTISPYGFVDPSDGGNTYRYALSFAVDHRDPNGLTHFSTFGEKYFLDLFSDFTYYSDDATNYYNITANPVTCAAAFTTCAPNAPGASRASNYASYCPAYAPATTASVGSIVPAPYGFQCGDQREQRDDRFITGLSFTRSFETPGSLTTLGFGTRNDNINTLGLFLAKNRVEFANGTLSNDHAVERGSNAWIESQLRLGKARFEPGIRADVYNFRDVAVDPRNSGAGTAWIVSPKMNVSYAFSRNSEVYLDFGEGFHSNDVRSVTYVDDPFTHRPFDSSGASVVQNSLLDRAVGEEIGYRYSQPRQTSTISLWALDKANELIFDGDSATPSIGGPTQRKGIELSNYFTLAGGVVVDADFATSTARFLDDPLHQGTGVPESLAAVVSSGVTIDKPHYAASLRMRYFGPRQLDTAGDYASPPSMLFNTQLTAKFGRGARLSFDVFNLLDAKVPDVTYAYNSWLPSDATRANLTNPAINPALGGAGIVDDHFHPSERRIVRLTFAAPL